MMPRFCNHLFVVVLFAATFLTGAAARSGEATIFVATWRGCEEACQGLKDYLVAQGHDITFVNRDAGQQKEVLPGLLAEARSSQADLIVSWGTNVTKAIAGEMGQLGDPAFNHDIPQVFMIVADPVGAKIIASLDAPGRPNLTGTYNRTPETVTLQTIRSYLPSFQTLGLLYNESERNSVLKYKELEALAATDGFELIARPIRLDRDGFPVVEDIAVGVREIARAGADFLYLGSSSFLRSNSVFLGEAAKDAKLPLLSPYEKIVADGHALVSVAARYYDVGRLAGQQVEAILFGDAAAGDLPLARMTRFAVTINLSVAREIGLYPSVQLLQIAEIVE